MATRPLTKKLSKRSISKSDLLTSPTSSSSSFSSSMDSSHMFRFNYKRTPIIVLILLAVCFVVLFCISSNMWVGFLAAASPPDIYTIQVVNEFPHDPKAFTQGLLYTENDTLFESTGLYGRSSVRRIALKTGKVEAMHEMDASYFGEGLTLHGDRLYQVTWMKKTGFIYDRNNLSEYKEFTHSMNDGWGLATNGKVFFGSDGSSTLYRIDPHTLKVITRKIVKYKGREVRYLNELEFINGEVWANIWQTDCIARISPEDGKVLAWIVLPNLREDLAAAGYHGIDVLNGIAWDGNQDRIFVTGKLWPRIFEIKLQLMKRERDDGFNVDTVAEHLCMTDKAY